jgi:hypothetical protein
MPGDLAKRAGAASTDTVNHADNPERTCINQAGVDKRYLDLFEHDPDEVIIADIHKHWIGLVGIWLVTVLSIVVIWLLASAASIYRDSVSESVHMAPSDITVAAIGLGVILTVLALLFGYVAAFLYVNNRIICTSEKMVQIRYFSLFNRKVSQLSIGDVQDVTARKNGILATIFGFGKISIETAGEQDNYEFPLAEDAEEYCKIMVQAHEENLHKYGN